MRRNVVEAMGNLYQKTHLLFWNLVLLNVLYENSLQLVKVDYIPMCWGLCAPDYLPLTPPKALEGARGLHIWQRKWAPGIYYFIHPFLGAISIF